MKLIFDPAKLDSSKIHARIRFTQGWRFDLESHQHRKHAIYVYARIKQLQKKHPKFRLDGELSDNRGGMMLKITTNILGRENDGRIEIYFVKGRVSVHAPFQGNKEYDDLGKAPYSRYPAIKGLTEVLSFLEQQLVAGKILPALHRGGRIPTIHTEDITTDARPRQIHSDKELTIGGLAL